jgi:uncharacterized RmlC-like cupin family protein
MIRLKREVQLEVFYGLSAIPFPYPVSDAILCFVDTQHAAECRVVHPDGLEVEVSSGSMTRLAGVSKALVGTEGIHLAIATIPPGCASSPHYHVNCESAIYVVKGQGRFLTGKNLEKSLPIGAGDFIYVPPDSVHQPVNDSLSEPMALIVARNAPVEIVVEYDPKTGSRT